MASDLATKETSEATAVPELIRSLHLTNYRGFENYRLNDLRRVNLLVGKNNAGKTAILEAVHLLASGGDLKELSRIGKRRGELAYHAEIGRPYHERCFLSMEHFFRGRRLAPGSCFKVSSEGRGHFLSIKFDNGNALNAAAQPAPAGSEAPRSGPSPVIEIEHHTRSGGTSTRQLQATNEGETDFIDPAVGLSLDPGSFEVVPVQFLTQDSLDRDSLAEMWDAVQMEGKEHEVVEALNILDDKVNRIVFLVGEGHRGKARGGIMLGYERMRRAVPLGSQGEGMRRMLGLALALVSCQNGILLIDEIDTGLHYSIMGDVWRLVVETAERLNVQVFATTHSFDCLRGLAWLCANHPDLGEEVSLQKIEPALAFAVSADADKIQIALEQNIEVR